MKDHRKFFSCMCKSRVSSEERFEMIVEAAAPLFAKNGFEGTTTKQIAKAAGVSEALIYKHFPSKEALYQEMQNYTCQEKQEALETIMTLPSNTDTLILMVYYYFQQIQSKIDGHQSIRAKMVKRLLMRSLLEDGHFVKIFLECRFVQIVEKFEECLKKAIQEGDIVNHSIPSKLGIWLAHHIAFSMGFIAMPETQVLDYGCSDEELLIQAVRFALRGLGFKDEVLKTKVNKEMLNEKIDQLSQEIPLNYSI